MNWTTIIVGQDHKEIKDEMVLSKENCSRHNPRRLVIVYISFEFDYNYSSYCYSIFLLVS